MLYTIMPLELIYAEEIKPDEEECINGVTMLYRRDAGGKKHRSRVISTDLSDYLKYTVE